MTARAWLLCLALCCAWARAAPLTLDPAQPQLALNAELELLVDASARLGLAEVLQQPDTAFAPATPRQLHPGYTRSAFWLRLRLHNPGPAPLTRHLLLNPARLEEVRLYVSAAPGVWQLSQAGTGLPFAQRGLPLRESAFVLELAPGATQTLLLRVASRTSVAIDLSLWQPQALLKQQLPQFWADGLVVGLALILVTLALLMGLIWRERAYAYIALHLACYALYESSMRGTSFMFWWPTATDWATRSLATLGGAAFLFEFLAVARLLQTARHQPWLHRLLCGLAVACTLALGLCLVGDYRTGTVANSALNTVLGLAMVLACARAVHQGQPLAKAWLTVVAAELIGMAPRYLVLLGQQGHSIWSDYAPPLIGVIGCMVVLTALAREMRRQRQRYEQGLERAVRERTAELAEATARAQDSDAAKGRLLGYIGHDLRAPLASVVHVTRSLRPDDEFEANRQAIERSGLLLLDMIDELQRYARAPESSAALEILPAPVYLHGLLHEISHQAQTLARAGGNQLQLLLPADLPAVVELDAKRLRQVLLNLLSNAAKFTQGGRIVLAVRAQGQRLLFSVQDNGPGIAEQDLALLFEPFERARATRHVPGTGLGLSIARQAVRSMGGDIAVQSQPGVGSLFSFELALRPADEAEVLWPALRQGLDAQPGEGRCALVLDGCPQAREALAERLALAGFDCLQAQDMAAAEALLNQHRPDLLIAEAEPSSQALVSALARWQTRYPAMAVLLCCARRPVAGLAAHALIYKPALEEEWWAALSAETHPRPSSVSAL